ncbi:hypothetical protein [Streptomyces sp. NPDC048057]|uniref:hypothetical protein n=1 Tax=Streptomyces sp. NPDC048057 TaxID=3155628 RepID=UPI0033CA0F39
MTRTVYAEWALLGKRAGEGHDYHILDSSRDRAEDARFEQLVRSSTPGTPRRAGAGEPGALPWVTFDVAGGTGERHWSGIAVKEWSEDIDRASRPITTTRYFTFPFAEAARPGVTYRGLYERVAPVSLPPPSTAAVPLDLPGFDARALAAGMEGADRGFDWYATVAALLLDAPVVLSGAGDLTLTERIDCLDAVVALLPYGVRATLRASTWADNLAEHGMRLFFGDGVDKPHQHEVRWQALPEPPTGTLGHVYLAALRKARRLHGGPVPLIERLAGERTPLELDDRAVVVALDCLSAGGAGDRDRRAAVAPTARAAGADAWELPWSDHREHIVTTVALELAAGRTQRAKTYLSVAESRKEADSFVEDVLAQCPPGQQTAAQADFVLSLGPPGPGASPTLRGVVVARPRVAYDILRDQAADSRAPLEAWIAWLSSSGPLWRDHPAPDWIQAFGALLPGRSSPVSPGWIEELVGRFGDDALTVLFRTAARTGTSDVALSGCWRALISGASRDGSPARARIGGALHLLTPRLPAYRAGMDVVAPLYGRAPRWAARTSREDAAHYLAGLRHVWGLLETAGQRETAALALVPAVPRDRWLLKRLRRLDPHLKRAIAARRRSALVRRLRSLARWKPARARGRSRGPRRSDKERRT